MNSLRKPDAAFTNYGVESVHAFLEVHHLIEFQHGSVARRTRTLCKEVTIKKAGSALLSFADFKGPGMDAIYPAMIKESKNRLL